MESNLAQDEPWDQLADITLVGMTPGLPLPDLLDIVRDRNQRRRNER